MSLEKIWMVHQDHGLSLTGSHHHHHHLPLLPPSPPRPPPRPAPTTASETPTTPDAADLFERMKRSGVTVNSFVLASASGVVGVSEAAKGKVGTGEAGLEGVVGAGKAGVSEAAEGGGGGGDKEEGWEVRSTGTGVSASVMRGKVCYRCCPAKEASAAASVPCLVCPRIRDCTPDGIISPRNCVYYKKWLNF
ncbi:hypothetical protein QJS10_CPA07g00653 [Acorus calamus]|uniref:Uncharacterized protein n=1 Tax=Acorus calamus TaxID=4465 RepID=A0AAV9EHS6_ACOCL|nr:hypothetical protein QJS10_CPA07g00653 [Acorus calamus]